MKSFESEKRGTPLGRAAQAGQSGELFPGSVQGLRGGKRSRQAPELAAARVLCNQLKRKRVSADKKRIIHLICLNLVAILKRRSQQA